MCIASSDSWTHQCRAGDISIQNGENLQSLIDACMIDELGNWCGSAPDDIDLTQEPSQLTLQIVSTTQSQQVPTFLVHQSEDRKHVYGGKWKPEPGLLCMPDLAIIGPPGPVLLTLSGGSSPEGQPLKPHTLSLELTLGEPTRAIYSGWPSGVS